MPILHWLDREDTLKVVRETPYRLLEEDRSLRCGDEDAQNLIVQGDNLAALKALLPYYAGQVKCIYIDPPYNTKSAFEHYDDNLEHAQWLHLMYPRLELLREFLREDGSIWVSVDDNEAHYLKVIMDEVFGRKNFVANAVWEKKYSPQNDAKWLSDSHDHIIVHAKNKEAWRPFLLPRTDAMNGRYKNPDNDLRGVWKPGDLSVKTPNPRDIYPITTPSGRVVMPPESRSWVISQEKFDEMVKDNRIWFGKDGNNVPSVKRFLSEVQEGAVSKTIWFREEVGDNQEAKKEIKIFNSDDVFTTPKPERLLKKIMELSTKPDDLVLDSFLGSGTTAAVAHKMNRRYIGIEMGDHAVTHVVPRLQKVVAGEQGGISQAANWQGGGGFRFFRLGEPIFDGYGQLNRAVSFAALAAHIWFAETHIPYNGSGNSPLLGVYAGTAYYLLYNGILGDKRPAGGNILTHKIVADLPAHDGSKVIFGEACRIGEARLQELGIIFRQIPYGITVR